MAHLFRREETQWAAVALTGDTFGISGANPSLPTGVVLRRAGTEDTGWILFTPPTVAARVNGEPVRLGLRALRDHDEIQLPGTPLMFFSTEKLVAVEPYTGPAGGKCPRCTKEIEAGSPAVRCGCGTWYHQNGEKDCFNYGGESAICVTCSNDAVVSEELTWVPDEV